MLYPRNCEDKLDPALFKNPSSEYRGAPFWAWNCKLDREEIIRQIDIFKQMGMGGYHVHVRTGMASPYLSDQFMDYVRVALEHGKKLGMLTWLYDEDRWPSGAGGGQVTKDPQNRIRYLAFTPAPCDPGAVKPGGSIGSVVFERVGEGELLAVYDILLDEDGALSSYRVWKEGQPVKGELWYAYLYSGSPNPWFNNQTYLNTLDKNAVEAFIASTHERYDQAFHEEFGKGIPAIFTDEPQFMDKSTLRFAKKKEDLFLPWTDDLPETYQEDCGLDLLAGLPELIWDLPEGVSLIRYHYHDHIAERFAQAYADTLGKWCGAHGLMLTGHVMEEPTLKSQTTALGEAMRSYRSFQLPGIDMLCDWREYNTAKQAQSAVHQYGAPGMLSELYGVTGWDFDFRGHKLQGDWQAALGVTVRVPHLTWMSMKGEAKRDYPASIGYQSPWYEKYALVEDHFARINTALTRGKPMVRVGVVHPVESYWLFWGPAEQTAEMRDRLEKQFESLTDILLFGTIDFDFISESQLPSLCAAGANPLMVGEMAYDTILVPGCVTIRSTTLERLEAFRAQGGKLIFLGGSPTLVDAVPSDRAKKLCDRSVSVGFDGVSILRELEGDRFISIRNEQGVRTGNILYQARRDGETIWVFLAVGKRPDCPDVDPAPTLEITFRGAYRLRLYDTLTGEIKDCPARYTDGETVLTKKWYMHDSLLLQLTPGKAEAPVEYREAWRETQPITFREKVPVTLSEPNALVLDTAQFSFDGGALRPEEELLRLDNICRRELGIPLRQKHILQPYLIEEKPAEHRVMVRFTIHSMVEVASPMLALEDPKTTVIRLNGAPVQPVTCGWYVDKAILTVKLPPLRKGENLLELEKPLGERTNLEWCYLLGDFGVRVEGAVKTIVEPVRELAFGDFVHQGLPFYTGNVTYHLDVETRGAATLRLPCYRGALAEVTVDGKAAGTILYSPYTLELSGLRPGKHRISVTLYGTRQNGFAQLHHTNGVYFYQSADSWRSTGDLWCDEYQLKPAGILKSPELYPSPQE